MQGKAEAKAPALGTFRSQGSLAPALVCAVGLHRNSFHQRSLGRRNNRTWSEGIQAFLCQAVQRRALLQEPALGAGGNVCRVRAASPVLVAQHFTTCRPLGECCCCFCLFLGSNSSITEEFVHLLVLGAFVEEPLGKEGHGFC